jgi:serine/threonine-protein kinase
MPLNAGQIVNGRYRIARLLGQGGMGAVYRAWDLTLNIPVALKEMLPDPLLGQEELAELRQQFRQEAQTLAGLIHPNLPRVTDFFEWQGNDYLVMDFIEGESLASIIEQQGAIPQQQVLQWGKQLLGALAACHARNVLHRDVKPQNIIICPDGRAVLVDFGLVKLWDPRKPQTQRIIRGMGTQEYASPEHFALSESHTEPRSDIYSLGATLYHALVGQVPPSAIERVVGQQDVVPPRYLGVQVDQPLETAILRAMALKPQERFSSAQGMTSALIEEVLVQGAARAGERAPQIEQPQTPPPARSKAAARPTHWRRELLTAMGLAFIATLALHGLLFGDRSPAEQYLGLSLGALLLGALAWFVGDTIFQSITMPDSPAVPGGQPVPGSRPTQRLVMSTRKLMRRLTPAQQAGILAALVVVAALAAWLIGPLIAEVPFLWNYLPSYAIAAPLIYAATGRRTGLAGAAHVLVAVIGGTALKASVGTTTEFSELLLASLAGGLLVEGLAFVAARSWLKGSRAYR